MSLKFTAHDLGKISEFSSFVSPWLSFAKRKITSVILAKPSDEYVILNARLVLSNGLFEWVAQQKTKNATFVLSPSIHAFRKVAPIKDAQDEISPENISHVSLGRNKYFLPTGNNAGHQIYSAIFPNIGLNESYGELLPAIHISTINKSVLFQNPYSLNAELRASNTPYVSLEELAQDMGLGNKETCSIELIVENPIKILATSTIEQRKSLIHIAIASGLDHNRITLGYKAFFNDRVERGVFEDNDISWKKETNEIETGSVYKDIGECTIMQVFASVDGVCLHDSFVVDPTSLRNIRAGIQSTFDPSHEKFERYVTGNGERRASNFEQGIADMLTILGFSVFYFGDNRYSSNCPDIVAITPTNKILVIDCTLEQPNNGHKLEKLQERARQVGRQISKYSSIPSPEVIPIVITSLEKEELNKDHLQRAEELKVLVLCKEDIEAGFQRMNFIPNPDSLYEDAKKRLTPDLFGRFDTSSRQ